MEKPPPEEHDHLHALPNEDPGRTSQQFKGIRLREWGKWVAEIRLPKSRQKIHLGSHQTAKQAARAFDAAMYCLRGPNAKFNFPNSVPDIQSASSLSHQEIQVAAAKYALNEIPSTSPSLHNSTEEPAQSSSVSGMELSSDEQQTTEELAFWRSLFKVSDSPQHLNLEKIPSIDELMVLDLISPLREEDEVNIAVDTTGLWNFDDV